MSRDSTIIYRSFYEAIKELPETDQAKCWQAVFEFSLNFKLIELQGISKTIFTLIKPQLEANLKRYKSGLIPKEKRKISKREAKGKRKVSESEANLNLNLNPNPNLNENQNVNIAEQSSAFTTLRLIFETWYEKKNGTKYYFNGKDAGSLKQLIKQIEFVNNGVAHEGERWKADAFLWLLEHLDSWELQHCSLAVINSKFNEIIARGKKESKELETIKKFYPKWQT